jgi:hypothetical protein
MRRAGVPVDRLGDGSWAIAPDYLERAAAFEEGIAKRQPVRVELLSPVPLEQLDSAEGATWLDRMLLSPASDPVRDAGFGKDVLAALAVRRHWLIEQQLGFEDAGGTVYKKDLIALLRRRELLRVSAKMADELGVPYVEAASQMRFGGLLERRLDLASGRFAVVASGREFTLVPWRASLERQIGREIEVKVGASGVSWTVGRGRSGPEIS